jgi:hypothetical protein
MSVSNLLTNPSIQIVHLDCGGAARNGRCLSMVKATAHRVRAWHACTLPLVHCLCRNCLGFVLLMCTTIFR